MLNIKSSVFINAILVILVCSCTPSNKNIKPYPKNPRYWEFKGEPVLLLGGSEDDNLFQMDSLEEHLDEMRKVGANFIRNTMSSRDEGNLWPFKKRENGKYDLNEWNELYWDKFQNLLKLTDDRDIIVQIELWDKFDFTREPWSKNPLNPRNNINFSSEECGLDEVYPDHPGADLQPFFHTIKGMQRYDPKLEVVKIYQQKLIDKILSHTFNYGNVLYCMNNETNTSAEWGNYWINYIRGKAVDKGIEVYLTDMYEEFHSLSECEKCLDLVAKPKFYTFMDISQINNRVFNEDHWNSLQLVISEREKYDLRPANCTKVYGGLESYWGSGTNQDGVERFCRNVIGGCAAVRHHRPEYGNGLNHKAKASIKAVRKAESLLPLWELNIQMDLLKNREIDEAYIAANRNGSYLLYFTEGGEVTVLTDDNTEFEVQWISVDSGEWGEESIVNGKSEISITAPDASGWFAVIKRVDN